MLNLQYYNWKLQNWHGKICNLGKSYFFFSSRVYKFSYYWKSLQEHSSNDNCEHVSNDLNFWHFTMNPIETTLKRPGDNRTHSRADNRCKWIPFSLQGEHFITTISWIPDGCPLQVRLRVVENIIPIPITVRTETFDNHCVTPKISRTLDKRENQSLDDLLDYMDKNLGSFNEMSHINIQHAPVDLYDIWT